jgi:hypothetical protein
MYSPEKSSSLAFISEQLGKDRSKYDSRYIDKSIDNSHFLRFDDDSGTFLKNITISRDQTEGSAFQEEQLAALENPHNRPIASECIETGQVGVVFALQYK